MTARANSPARGRPMGSRLLCSHPFARCVVRYAESSCIPHTLRFLRAVRLALLPARRFNQCFPGSLHWARLQSPHSFYAVCSMKIKLITITTLLALTLIHPAWANAQEAVPEQVAPATAASDATPTSVAPKPAAPRKITPKIILPAPTSATPALVAKSYFLYDLSSKQTLLSLNENERVDPAWLAKLMTAYVSFSALRAGKISLSEEVMPTVENLRGQIGEPRMFLSKNKTVAIAELLHGLVVLSGNDAARTLAVAVAGSEEKFVALMNAEAQRLNMHNSHFMNSTGVPEVEHYSTAADLGLLAVALLRDFPDMYSIYKQREFQYNNIKQANRNQLLWMDPLIDGMEIAHATGQGASVVASSKREQRRLVAVVLGAATDNISNTEAQKLLNHGFQHFETVRLYQKNQPVTSIRLWKGTESELNVGFREDLFITVPTGKLAQLSATMETAQPLFAPISSSQKIGTLRLTLEGKLFGEYPLVALERVPVANVLSRGWDNIQLFFQ